jgi:hypothetical protein
MFRKSFAIIALCAFSAFSQLGVKAFGCKVDGAGYGGGAGFFGQVNLNKIFSFYPGVDLWYSTEDNAGITHDAFGIDFNLDFKARLPIGPRLGPYCGLGIVPQAYASRYKPSYKETPSPSVDFSGNAFVGFDFPIKDKLSGLLEARYRLGGEYDALKLSLGVIF